MRLSYMALIYYIYTYVNDETFKILYFAFSTNLSRTDNETKSVKTI